MRAELDAVTTGFGKLPVLAASALKLVRVNAGATALESTNLIDGITIGSVTPAPGTFTTLASTGLATLASATVTGAFTATSGTINGVVVGGVTPAAGTFTTLASTGLATLASATVTGVLTVTGALVANGNVTLGDALADTITIGGGSSKNATGNWVFAAPSIGLSGMIVNGNATTQEPVRLTTSVARGGGQLYLPFYDPTGNKGYIGYGGSSDGMQVANLLNGALEFYTNSVPRVTIAAVGNVTIAPPSSGTTLTLSGTAAADLISASDGTTTFIVQPNGASGTFIGTSSITSGHALQIGTASAVRVAIAAAGNVTIIAPTAGVGLTQTGFAGSDTAIFNGGTSGSFRVNTTGVPYATSAHNNAGAVTGTTNQYFCSGTYTATLTNTTNVAASTAFSGNFMRVGNVVTVSGMVDIDPTAASVATVLGISLPIASNLANSFECCGTAVRADGTTTQQIAATIVSDTANDRATLTFICDTDAANRRWHYHFTYLIL